MQGLIGTTEGRPGLTSGLALVFAQASQAWDPTSVASSDPDLGLVSEG